MSKKVGKIEELIDKKRLEQQKLSDLKVLEDMPGMIPATELYDPNYVVKPLEFEGLRTGLPTLDQGLLGIQGKELVFMGAPTNIGKTTVALFIALNFAAQGKKVVYMLAEDSTDWATDLLNALIKSNPGTEAGINNLMFITDEESIKFVGKSKDLVPLINGLRIDYDVDWFFLDMLNNLADPLEDRNFSNLMSQLRQNCNRLGHSIWCNCRFREPHTDSQATKERETYSPDMTMFYGKSTNYMFSVTKALALTECELPEVGARSLAIKILKNKRCQIGSIGKRHRLLIDGDLRIWQPQDAVLDSEVMPLG